MKLLWRLASLPLLALPLALLLSLTPSYERASLLLDDALLSLAARPVHYDEVLAADIDDASLRNLQPQLGDWPYRRDVYSLLLNYLRDAGARVVVFDIVFSGPRDGDAALAAALNQRSDVVLAAAGLPQPIEVDNEARALLQRLSRPVTTGMRATAWSDITLPHPQLFDAMAAPDAIGMVSTPLDEDGRLRHLPLLHEVHGRVLPALPLAALARAGHIGWQLHGDQLSIGAQRWTLDAHGRVRATLPANADAVPLLDWGRLMRAALGESDDPELRERIRGRALFIGSSAFFADPVMTAVGQRSGTQLLAGTYAAMSRGQLVADAPWPAVAGLWLLALLPAAWTARSARPQLARHVVPVALALLTVLAIAVVLLQQRQLLLPVIGPLWMLAFGLALTAAAELRWEHLTHQRLSYERAVADAANRSKSEFLAHVSHEIRTPMNALLGMADLLGRTRLDAQQRHYVEVFHSAGQALFSLINDLLDLSKIEAGRAELQPDAFNPEALFLQQLNLLRPRAEAKGLSLSLQMEPDARQWAHGDPQRLAQVLVNLAGNAIKFTREGGVTVRAQRKGELLAFSVQDTGIGVEPSKHDMIFRPYTQADGSIERVYGGTGLGLSICRTLVALMGGRIWLESLPGQGATFFVELPMPAIAAPPPSAQPPVAALAGPTRLVPLNILLCEDTELNVLVFEAMLLPLGHRVDHAENGLIGLHKFRSGRYDLVLMDVQMPGMDGLAATRELRRIEREDERVRTPVIALTANAFDADAQRSLDAGCDAHLTKPISQAELLEALGRYGRPDHGQGQVLPDPPEADARPAEFRH
ncbi:CHASE2 domain-containing protein [Paucibacter sp. R3-3]|uniref:histidine kinase n=1 Tax=Roseateles agri TaxID=3098619 RepID=A0ABU5DCR1_9BURK|nr:CHASE2 domain-containing protein [Paucibacter sp. R3-3]MDY0744071.1 CHASE2 domain-containing protein [Paucibacter sp. R3-3]